MIILLKYIAKLALLQILMFDSINYKIKSVFYTCIFSIKIVQIRSYRWILGQFMHRISFYPSYLKILTPWSPMISCALCSSWYWWPRLIKRGFSDIQLLLRSSCLLAAMTGYLVDDVSPCPLLYGQLLPFFQPFTCSDQPEQGLKAGQMTPL